MFSAAQPRKKPVHILYPCNGEKYRYIDDSPMRQEISLRAEAETSEQLYWFIDGKLLASASSGKNSWDLQRGKHSITCSDSAGRNDTVVVVVE
jgi:membrane carboxypeptidase/penicillin-binding protein PbpC